MENTTNDPVLPGKVSVLINPHYFFLDRVFIKEEEKGFCLVVQSPTQILYEGRYETIRGARIAFLKVFGSHPFKKRLNTTDGNKEPMALWSHIYTPEWDKWKGIIDWSLYQEGNRHGWKS